MTATLTRWVTTTPEQPWQEHDISATSITGEVNLSLSGEEGSPWEGFGGCFNELGWIALGWLEESARAQVIADLFDTQDGCRFNFCRLPIGASDYAAEWYSLNETPDDFAMEHFSIERDRQYLIPYIKMAQRHRPDMKLFASPWSPPTWMKFPRAYNYGTFIQQPEYLEAYALYFQKFVDAYRSEGITINQVHVQNEPVADQKFPSCIWTGAQMRDFIRDYLGPRFRKEQLDCEIWFGTLNTENYDGYPNTALSDPEARRYIDGIGFQWAGKGAIQRTHQSWPEVRLMQTENECGDGRNTWEYAHYIFDLICHYITNGVIAYVYWNMVLQPTGRSTWGWTQNAMITIDPETRQAIYNPEFYIMKHFSRFIEPGAKCLGLHGPWAGNAVAFANPDGSTVLVVTNPFPQDRQLTFRGPQGDISVIVKGNSFHTLVIS